ncbi:MAG: hypothetical protein ABIC04_04720 [Nanoarchaeota archaeon]
MKFGKKEVIIGIFIVLLAALISILTFKLLYNIAPEISYIAFVPQTVYTDYHLKGDIKFTDEDDAGLETFFRWYKNGQIIFQEKIPNSVKAAESILRSGNYSKNDMIAFEAYVSDGRKESKHEKIEVKISNAPPEQPVIIGPGPESDEDVVFEWKSFDIDEDNIEYKLIINDKLQTTNEDKISVKLEKGKYSWRITASDGIDETVSPVYNLTVGKPEKTIKKGPNKPPKLIRKIENQSWGVFGFNLHAFNLNSYFEDEDELTFSTEGSSNITVLIGKSGSVSFLHPKEWHGSEYIRFIADDGIAKTKSNIVKLEIGKGEVSEESICPGPCCGISCGKTSRICEDGTHVSCVMGCISGQCVPCAPVCGEIDEPPAINLYGLSSGMIYDEIPCINMTGQKSKALVSLKDKDFLNIPEGYSIISGPFSLECAGPVDMTINIPANYEDIKALRCEKNNCYPTILQKVSELKCGEDIVQRQTKKEAFFTPELKQIKERKLILNEKSLYNEEGLRVEFSGDGEINIRTPILPVKEAINPSLKILSTPIILDIIKGSNINVKITLPYINSERILEDSISIYIKKDDEWNRLKGEQNKNDKTITAEIENIGSYGKEVMISLMGVMCNDCFKTEFIKEYTPVQKSTNMIVMVHGLASEPITFKEIIDDVRLTNQPYHMYNLDYSSYLPIVSTAKDLRDFIELESKQFDRIYIIAHSLGGLVAQQALYTSYLENQKDSSNYTFIRKVRKVILASVPNEGSPAAKLYNELFDYYVNQDSPYALFEMNSAIINDLTNGLIVPRVPYISYYAIAGTVTYPFFDRLAAVVGDLHNGEKNDGIVSVTSAQHVGHGYLNKYCENYWEFNVTHMNTIDDERARKVILSIISEDEVKNNELPTMGNNKYFELAVPDCTPEDSFIIIGKPIKMKLTYQITCGFCGDGCCSKNENIISCPRDCIINKKIITSSLYAAIAIIVGILITLFILKLGKKRLDKNATEKLKNYITQNYATNIKEGYTILEVKDMLAENGWNPEIIDSAMLKITQSFKNKIITLSRRMQELQNIYTYTNLVDFLTKEGWNADLIKEVARGERIKIRFLNKKKTNSKFLGFSN